MKRAARQGAAGGRGAVAKARPFEPPVPMTDDLDDRVSPPLYGKTHPPAEMDGPKPTLDDEVRRFHHHPNDAGATTFGFDPEAADAAADLAGDLGATFLSGATRGQDMSDLTMIQEDREESDVPFVIEEESEETGGEAAPPVRRRR